VNKRLIIFGVLLAALLLSAVSPWPAVLTVVNYTGDNIYITLKFRGEQKYFLTATPKGNSETYYVSRFDIVRRRYSATVTACGTTGKGGMNFVSNVRLVFTGCEAMKQWWTPKYWGEPTMEKPNFWNFGTFLQHVPENDPHYGWQWYDYRFRFQYDVAPAGNLCWNDSAVYPFMFDYCP